MQLTKLVILVGEPGSKIDFAGGWLGTLDNFFSSEWSICSDTGQSNGMMSAMVKPLEHPGASIDALLADHYLKLDHNATRWSSGTCHGFQINQIEPYYSQGLIKLAVIDTSEVSRLTIRWNFLVKTFLNKNYPNKFIDHDSAIQTCEYLLNKNETFNFDHIPGIRLSYSKLFCPGGSKYLCDSLGFVASVDQHTHWNNMLPLTEAPDTVSMYNRTWNRTDMNFN